MKTVTQLYLSLRNVRHVKKNEGQVPTPFDQKITLAEHQKAAQYTTSKAKFSHTVLLFDFWILILWTLGGGLQKLDAWVVSLGYSPLVSGLVFFALFSLIGTVLDLPQSLYETFVIEEKFGFNKTTPKLFFVDMLKQLLLGVVIGLPFLAGLLKIIEALTPTWWPYAWVFLSLFQLGLLWIYPTFLAPLFNKFTPLEEGPVKEKVLALLKRVQFDFSGLFVMDASRRSSHGNAYFTGFGKSKRIVFFDTLLKDLTPGEVEAILAHELGHFKKKHIIKSLILSFVMSALGLWCLNLFEQSPWFYEAFGVNQSSYMALILFSLTLSTFTYFLTPLFSYFSRKNEFEADDFAAQYADAKELISGLTKLYRENASSLTPDPVYTSFYHSHPPALERIKHLNKSPTQS